MYKSRRVSVHLCIRVCTTVCEMVMREENFVELYPRRAVVAAGTTILTISGRRYRVSTNAPVVSLVTERRTKINPDAIAA